jgi:hypothetical protein
MPGVASKGRAQGRVPNQSQISLGHDSYGDAPPVGERRRGKGLAAAAPSKPGIFG